MLSYMVFVGSPTCDGELCGASDAVSVTVMYCAEAVTVKY